MAAALIAAIDEAAFTVLFVTLTGLLLGEGFGPLADMDAKADVPTHSSHKISI